MDKGLYWVQWGIQKRSTTSGSKVMKYYKSANQERAWGLSSPMNKGLSTESNEASHNALRQAVQKLWNIKDQPIRKGRGAYRHQWTKDSLLSPMRHLTTLYDKLFKSYRILKISQSGKGVDLIFTNEQRTLYWVQWGIPQLSTTSCSKVMEY